MVGKTVKDRYQIVESIGEGGMGVVYKSIDLNLKRAVAIKMLHAAHANGMEKTRFQIEAVITAGLNHPSIVTLYDFFEEQGNNFLVMELLEGKTAKELVEQKGQIPLQQLLWIFNGVIEGVAYAHRHGIIHRDIKPNNIMITNSDQVKIMDFGIARAMDSPHMTQVGFTVGSALYMSPEQIKNQQVDYRSDIYSLGITMFEMATGRAPFYDSASEYNILIGHISTELPSPRSINPQVPEELEIVIKKATQKNPGDRYQTMEEVGAALASTCEPTRVRPIAPDRMTATLDKPKPASRERVSAVKSPGGGILSFMRQQPLFLIIVLLAGAALAGTLAMHWLSGDQDTAKITVPSPATIPRMDSPASGTHPRQDVASLPPEEKRPELPKPAATEPAPIPLPTVTPVKISKFKTFYLAKNKGPAELKESDSLTERDRYYVMLSPDEPLYIYLAQIDSSGVINPIFPNTQFSSRSNPLSPSEYKFPENEYFFLGGTPGKEYLYVIASKTPNERLERLYAELGSADPAKSKILAAEFMQILSQQETDNIRTLWFWHK